jgi:anaerobic ribonucleoside-triphosphate reductase
MISEEVKKIIRENDSAHWKYKKRAVKLPCCNISVEILRPEDQTIICPKCGKQNMLVWSKLGNHKLHFPHARNRR